MTGDDFVERVLQKDASAMRQEKSWSFCIV